jgi:hypothetical protein
MRRQGAWPSGCLSFNTLDDKPAGRGACTALARRLDLACWDVSFDRCRNAFSRCAKGRALRTVASQTKCRSGNQGLRGQTSLGRVTRRCVTPPAVHAAKGHPLRVTPPDVTRRMSRGHVDRCEVSRSRMIRWMMLTGPRELGARCAVARLHANRCHARCVTRPWVTRVGLTRTDVTRTAGAGISGRLRRSRPGSVPSGAKNRRRRRAP